MIIKCKICEKELEINQLTEDDKNRDFVCSKECQNKFINDG